MLRTWHDSLDKICIHLRVGGAMESRFHSLAVQPVGMGARFQCSICGQVQTKWIVAQFPHGGL